MPCELCENGKWRFGETGACEYESKEECERANGEAEQTAYADLTHIVARVFDTPLMVAQPKLEVIVGVLGDKLGLDVPRTRGGMGGRESERSYLVMDGGIAVIPIHGTLVHRTKGFDALSGMMSYKMIGNRFDAAMNDSMVNSIILDVDSHGGEINGVFDLSDKIFAARGEKPVYGLIDELAYSAAYALISGAEKIYCPRTGGAGSIGVITAHVDESEKDKMEGRKVTFTFAGKRKADFNKHEPLSKEAQKTLEAHVQSTQDLFVATVARNRGLSEDEVRATEAAFFIGKSALNAGLVDVVMSTDDALIEISEKPVEVFMSDGKGKTKDGTDEVVIDEGLDTGGDAGADGDNIIDFKKKLAEAKGEGKASAALEFKKRSQEITDMCALADMPHLSGGLIASEKTIDEARTAVFEEKAKVSDGTNVLSTIGIGAGDDHGWPAAFEKTARKTLK